MRREIHIGLMAICLYTLGLLLYGQQEHVDSIPSSRPPKKGTFLFNGQLTGWSVFQFSDPVQTQLGGRFVPTLTGNYDLPGRGDLDFEASLNTQVATGFSGTAYDTVTTVFKPYRVWLRYYGDNWELRGGLQKINFGAAKMFRPLMWFDRMDVRDPIQLTDGVYGLLGKYFFHNNANIWLWALIGNDRPKGFELTGSARAVPEVGGRVQFPLGPGELAFTTHFRKADPAKLFPSQATDGLLREKRLGIDGKWDIGIGLWMEASTTVTQENNWGLPRFQDFLNVGADYTLPFGNGVGLSAEYFRYHAGEHFFTDGDAIGIAGAMFDYPVSLIDHASAMFFYVESQRLWFNYLSYKRSYNKLDIYLIGFWNPEADLPIGPSQSGQRNLFAGKGLQLMIDYHF